MFPISVNNLETFKKLSQTLQGEQNMLATLRKVKESSNAQSDKIRTSSYFQNGSGQNVRSQSVDRKGPKLSGFETVAGYKKHFFSKIGNYNWN